MTRFRLRPLHVDEFAPRPLSNDQLICSIESVPQRRNNLEIDSSISKLHSTATRALVVGIIGAILLSSCSAYATKGKQDHTHRLQYAINWNRIPSFHALYYHSYGQYPVIQIHSAMPFNDFKIVRKINGTTRSNVINLERNYWFNLESLFRGELSPSDETATQHGSFVIGLGETSVFLNKKIFSFEVHDSWGYLDGVRINESFSSTYSLKTGKQIRIQTLFRSEKVGVSLLARDLIMRSTNRLQVMELSMHCRPQVLQSLNSPPKTAILIAGANIYGPSHLSFTSDGLKITFDQGSLTDESCPNIHFTVRYAHLNAMFTEDGASLIGWNQ